MSKSSGIAQGWNLYLFFFLLLMVVLVFRSFIFTAKPYCVRPVWIHGQIGNVHCCKLGLSQANHTWSEWHHGEEIKSEHTSVILTGLTFPKLPLLPSQWWSLLRPTDFLQAGRFFFIHGVQWASQSVGWVRKRNTCASWNQDAVSYHRDSMFPDLFCSPWLRQQTMHRTSEFHWTRG